MLAATAASTAVLGDRRTRPGRPVPAPARDERSSSAGSAAEAAGPGWPGSSSSTATMKCTPWPTTSTSRRQVRRRPGRRQVAAIHGPVGLQEGLGKRRRGLGIARHSLFLSRTGPGRRRRRVPRLHGQAGGHRRPGRSGHRGRGEAGDAEETLLPGRLPDVDRPGEHRNCPADLGRRLEKIFSVTTWGSDGGTWMGGDTRAEKRWKTSCKG